MTIWWRQFFSVWGKSWSYTFRKRGWSVDGCLWVLHDWSTFQIFSPLHAFVFYVPWVSLTLTFLCLLLVCFHISRRCLWWKIRRHIGSDFWFTVIFLLPYHFVSFGTMQLHATARAHKSFSSVWQHDYIIGAHFKSCGCISFCSFFHEFYGFFFLLILKPSCQSSDLLFLFVYLNFEIWMHCQYATLIVSSAHG